MRKREPGFMGIQQRRQGVRSRSGSLQEVSQEVRAFQGFVDRAWIPSEVYMPFYRLVRPITLAFRLGHRPWR